VVAHVLELDEVDLAYEVHGVVPASDGRPPLLLIGQPMDAPGFRPLVARLPERTVVTYDPRGLGRSVRRDGYVEHVPDVQARDVHTLIRALGGGPVDMFASSGGAVTALALVAAHPEDVGTLVAHEPPLIGVLPDADAARRAWAEVRETYDKHGGGAGMAAFIRWTSWRGEFTDDYFAGPAPDPAAVGLPTEDDGRRDDPLLARSDAVCTYAIDARALAAAPTRIVVAAGEESADQLAGRGAAGVAALLGQAVTLFPSHHTGFGDGTSGPLGEPDAFAERLREVLDA
jgi:pimeloyl-ACP methyl ester carboxylesterase